MMSILIQYQNTKLTMERTNIYKLNYFADNFLLIKKNNFIIQLLLKFNYK